MNWETAHAQEVGGRDEQQDRVTVLNARDGNERLLVVADGAGGHAGGASAAQAVIDAATDRWHKHLVQPASPETLLADICFDAHERIAAFGTGRTAPRSTCVALYTNDKVAHWANVGDSRVYHFRRGRVLARSKDHSVVQMLVDMGKIDESEMGDHPDQNRLTQSLGGEKPPEPEFGRSSIEEGDGFLLCSDGLWEVTSTDEMAAGLADGSLGHAAKVMVRQAALRGGNDSDNVSMALARLRSHQRRVSRIGVLVVALVAVTAAIGTILGLGQWLAADNATGIGASSPPRQTTAPLPGADEAPSPGFKAPPQAPGPRLDEPDSPVPPVDEAPVPLSPDDRESGGG